MSDSKRCLIIGASHAGVQIAFALRKQGWTGDIAVYGDEDDLPYHRPPLSKDLLSGARSFDQIQLRPQAMFDKSSVSLELGKNVVEIKRDRSQIVFADGHVENYDRLVLATGARARVLPIAGNELAGVHYLRDAKDVRAIQASLPDARRAVIVGGGYIGLEAAATFRKLGLEVTVVEAAERLLARVTGEAMSEFFARVHTEEGVELLTNTGVQAIHGDEKVEAVELSGGMRVTADMVVIGIGVLPNQELAAAAGLETNDGVVANEFGQTVDPNIFAIGDCARSMHPRYGEQLRVESVQNANDQALGVARAIMGDWQPYMALPWFWSDQYDVKLQIAGLAAGHDQIIQRGSMDSGRSFSLCYLKGDSLLAVDAINKPKDFVQARKLIADGVRIDPQKLANADAELGDAVVD